MNFLKERIVLFFFSCTYVQLSMLVVIELIDE